MGRERKGQIKEDEERKIFTVRVTYHNEQGKRKDVRRRVKDRTTANRQLRTLLRTLEDHGGKIMDASRMHFNELADAYEKRKLIAPVYKGETRIAGLRSWKTQLGYLKILRAYFGKQRIQTITHADLEKYRKTRLETPKQRGGERTITGVNRELALLRSMLNFARRECWLVHNPFERGESLISQADENRRDRILTEEEEGRLLAVCADKNRAHIQPLIIGALDTGMRIGELLKLKWSDIDFHAGLIHVRKTTTKTWEGRTIGLTSRFRAELQRLWDRGTGNAEELVFGLKNNIKTAFTTARRLAGLEDLHFHDLRHTATTRMIRAGMPPMEVMKITGHREISTFLRYL
ncbi:MAG: tyrosine-type recombinase/integrase, partial [Blastocatellia bacterium]